MMLETYLSCLELGYFEVGEAFGGLADESVWKRPAQGLLSVGELAGHIAFWEAVKFAGRGGFPALDVDQPVKDCPVASPLVDPRFGYYPLTLANPPTAEHLAMSAEQVLQELRRVHDEAVAHFRSLGPDLDSHVPGWESHWTYREFLKYAIFHVSYHTGQMYSARHLLGETTPDN